ncbi:hypothetical protein MMC08_001064 [Hypocenomyce scalaris]|nr:hypothetical protein [Hypocenomyce scalaris]
MGNSIPSTLISALLSGAIRAITLRVQRIGDSVLGAVPVDPSVVFQWNGEMGLALNVANSNNLQTTWGVLGAALTALEDYMQSQNVWGSAQFTIFDGANEVGQGTLN